MTNIVWLSLFSILLACGVLLRGAPGLVEAAIVAAYQRHHSVSFLANTLGKLIEIEGSANKQAKPHKTREMQDIREKLVQRIEELRRV